MNHLKFSKIDSFGTEVQSYINNITNIYETYFGDSDSRELTNLVKYDLKKIVFQNENIMDVDIEDYLSQENIKYEVFNPNNKNQYIIIHSFLEKHVSTLIDFFYQVTAINGIGLLCLGDDIPITFEKIYKNKLNEFIFGETWLPKCKLNNHSACAFLQYDGASLVIAENGNELFLEH